ncbi:MAG: sulfite exporter TauE/SafE family protein [Gammaproteobacteria bacterium]|nr:sulfite exporter TauE/SafE family protein [Gammaproteobacteria bacterium]
MLFDILIYAPILGILAGVLSGLLGIGGGIVIVPALIYLLPILDAIDDSNVALVAIATSLFTIIVTTFSSAKSHYKKGNLDIAFTLPIIIAVAVTAFIAPYVATWLGGESLKILFAVLMMLLAVNMTQSRHSSTEQDVPASKVTLAFGGVLTGFLAAIAGLGGGAILVPYLSFIKVNIRKAIAAAAASGMVVAIFGTIGFMINGWYFSDDPDFIGFVHWPTAIGIMIFSYLSAPYGVKLGQRLNQSQLKKVFALFMILVAVEMLIEQL